MTKLVTKVLATGAAVSMLTLPGLAPAVSAPSLGDGSNSDSPSEQSASSRGAPAAAGDDSAGDGAETNRSETGDSASPADADETGDTVSVQEADAGTEVQLLNITDFHGRISETGTQVASVIEEQRANFTGADRAGTAVLSTGDNIGASTYVSSSQNDTPTLDVLNAIGMQASAVGNHEFDKGLEDLTGRVTDEADFPYSGANVYDKGTKSVVDGLDEYSVIDVGGVKIAVIGVVTKDTASLVSPAGIADIDFGDPTDAVNRVAGEIEELPDGERPDMTVVEAHLGASSTKSLEDAEASNAEFKKLVTKTDASVDALFTGHTHLPYSFEAPVPGEPDRTRPVIEAGSYGEYVGRVSMRAAGNGDWQASGLDLIETKDKSYDSEVVDEVADIVSKAESRAKELGSDVSGTISEDITRAKKDGKEDRGAESTLGNLVADALKEGVEETQLEEADFGITNPGGLRTDLLCDDIYNDEDKCEVTVAELNSVLPFANDHGVVTMKGEDVVGLFEEQWQPEDASRSFLHLGVSDDLDVVYDSNADKGEHVKSVKVDGEEIDPKKEYRVATLSFLAGGGDNFFSFAEGDFEQSGLTDFETWENYFNKREDEHKKVTPDKNERQADAAEDVIASGDVKAELTGPKSIKPGESAEFVLTTDAKSEVAGPIDVTVNVPEGYTAEVAGKSSAQVSSANAGEVSTEAKAAKTITLDAIPAGESETPVTVTAPKGASGEVTVKVGLQANADGPWWDDNPLPLAHEFAVTAAVGDDAKASAGDDGSADGGDDGSADGGDDGSASAGDADGGDSASADGNDGSSNSSDSADGGSSNASGSSSSSSNADGSGSDSDGSKDGGDLPRTGFETANIVAAALALIVAGATAVSIVRRRKINAES